MLSLACAAEISTVAAPEISGKNNSRPAISKAIVVKAATRSLALQPGLSRIANRKADSAAWDMRTPLGVPVEPDVKIT